MKKYYIIAPHFGKKGANIEGTHNFIVHCRSFDRWWSNVPLVWIVETSLNSSRIAEILKPTMGTESFLVARIDEADINGYLPRYAWDWFYPDTTTTNQLTGYKEVPAQGILSTDDE